ncbi:MAG: hypothetical protein C9356_20115 [Oleiphilus sp.]|nr:MAG: hypothetical protein C9356_20115 [Oleiphilus sp.]
MKVPRLLPNRDDAFGSFALMMEKLETYVESSEDPRPVRVYWIVFSHSIKGFSLIAALMSLIILGNELSDGPVLVSLWFGAIIVYLLYGVGKATYRTAQDLVLNPQGNAWCADYKDKTDSGEFK